jgi:hypothetical protein
MNSERFWLVAALLASTAFAAAAGCDGSTSAPCTSCAPIEGRYPLQFASGTLPEDCAALGVDLPRGLLEIQRMGNALNATLETVPMQGTLYQNAEFTLLGSQTATDGGTTQFSLTGMYIPGPTDGGAGQLSGSFTGTYNRPSPQGMSRCSLIRPYTATQLGQP